MTSSVFREIVPLTSISAKSLNGSRNKGADGNNIFNHMHNICTRVAFCLQHLSKAKLNWPGKFDLPAGVRSPTARGSTATLTNQL